MGLPFLLFWIVLWVTLTAPVMGVVYLLDEAAARRPEKAGRVADAGET